MAVLPVLLECGFVFLCDLYHVQSIMGYVMLKGVLLVIYIIKNEHEEACVAVLKNRLPKRKNIESSFVN